MTGWHKHTGNGGTVAAHLLGIALRVVSPGLSSRNDENEVSSGHSRQTVRLFDSTNTYYLVFSSASTSIRCQFQFVSSACAHIYIIILHDLMFVFSPLYSNSNLVHIIHVLLVH